MDLQSQLYDIYGFWHVPFWQTRWFFYACCGVGVLVLIAAIVLIYRWHMRKPALTYWQEAINQLTALLPLVQTNPEYCYQAYAKLVLILKEYLSKRYDVTVRAMTDEELLVFLVQASCSSEVLQLVERILRGGTEIRFAGETTSRDVTTEAINGVIIIIKKTIPTESEIEIGH